MKSRIPSKCDGYGGCSIRNNIDVRLDQFDYSRIRNICNTVLTILASNGEVLTYMNMPWLIHDEGEARTAVMGAVPVVVEALSDPDETVRSWVGYFPQDGECLT